MWDCYALTARRRPLEEIFVEVMQGAPESGLLAKEPGNTLAGAAPLSDALGDVQERVPGKREVPR